MSKEFTLRRPNHIHMCCVCNRNTSGCHRYIVETKGEPDRLVGHVLAEEYENIEPIITTMFDFTEENAPTGEEDPAVVAERAALGIISRLTPFYFAYCVRGFCAVKGFPSRVFFKDAWLCRKESVGNNAPLTLAIDGTDLFEVLNNNTDPRTAQAFDKMCEDLGYYWEFGHNWSVHFYPKDYEPTQKSVQDVPVSS